MTTSAATAEVYASSVSGRGRERIAFRDADEALEHLAARSRRIASTVRAISRRRDVALFRAKLVLLVLELRCPLRRKGRRDWYVPGAVARLGAEGLRRAWSGFYGEEPPTLRTFRAHLGELYRAVVLVRAPGDWMPYVGNYPERRPRYPDTFHVVDTEDEARWWAEVGIPHLEKNPEVRHNPDRWRTAFANWRGLAATWEGHQGNLFDDQPSDQEDRRGARRLRHALQDPSSQSLDILAGLRECGVRIGGRLGFQLAGGDLARLRGVSAMFLLAMRRKTRIRSRSGWLVWAWKYAELQELRTSLQRVGAPFLATYGGTSP